MAAGKTVVRIRLASPELSNGLTAAGVRSFSGELNGHAPAERRGRSRPSTIPSRRAWRSGAAFSYSFLRAVKPGTYHVKLVFTDPGGGHVLGDGEAELSVPEVGGEFRPEMAPGDASTLPDAEAIVIADEAAGAGRPRRPGEPLLKILPPGPRGAGRPPAARGGGRSRRSRRSSSTSTTSSSSRARGPRTPSRSTSATSRAGRRCARSATTTTGAVVDEDAWAINEGNARVAVRVLPQPRSRRGQGPRQGRGPVDLRRRREEGRALPRREEDRHAGPRLPTRRRSRTRSTRTANYLRATAISEDGKEANDIRMLKGPSTTVESVRVDVVQLHVSALDKAGPLRQGPRRRTTSPSRRTASRSR